MSYFFNEELRMKNSFSMRCVTEILRFALDDIVGWFINP